MTTTSLLSKLLLAATGLTALAQSTPRTIGSASLTASARRDDRDAVISVQAFGGICNIGALSPGGVSLEKGHPHFISGNQFNLPEMSLCQLIAMAYDVAGFQISGAPQWMLEPVRENFYRVQIRAAGEDALTVDQARELLRQLLADRFQLKLHRESRTVPVYELTTGPYGSKLKEDEKFGSTTAAYIVEIAPYVDRPIVDKTGVGEAVRFQWFSSPLWGKEKGVGPVPELFRALEDQLGLTLKSAEDPVEFLIIDHAVLATLN
ncbi:MAG TPA: TIGR03435 family protein [Bryobacteraceae bacterium]|nr:TIGR03435 family protein [Bryobacteraceae bacterium]